MFCEPFSNARENDATGFRPERVCLGFFFPVVRFFEHSITDTTPSGCVPSILPRDIWNAASGPVRSRNVAPCAAVSVKPRSLSSPPARPTGFGFFPRLSICRSFCISSSCRTIDYLTCGRGGRKDCDESARFVF